MEPNDLNSITPPDDAHLDAWLRANSALPPLPDDGFSQRVLTALPAANARPDFRRTTVCLAGAFAGLLVAAWPLVDSSGRTANLATLESSLARTVEQLTTPAMGLALAITAGSLLYVYWRELRRLAPW